MKINEIKSLFCGAFLMSAVCLNIDSDYIPWAGLVAALGLLLTGIIERKMKKRT